MILLAACSSAFSQGKIAREQLLLDFGWKFHLGNAANPESDFGYGADELFAKAGAAGGAAAPDFNDSSWRSVDLPHDWAVELPFVHVEDQTLHDHGFKPIGRKFPATSIGWYRRSFNLPASDVGRRLMIKFDGVYRDCIVWLNGHFLGRNLSGYSGFDFDITDYARLGGRNVLVVRVDVTQSEGWFYEGAGIYRHTWLLKYAPLHVPLYGIYVTTSVHDGSATVNIETKVVNQQSANADCRMFLTITDPNGREVGNNASQMLHVDGFEEKSVKQRIEVPHPDLWSPDHPSLYKMISRLTLRGKTIDSVSTPFGIRSIRFDSNNGLILNGRRIEIKGVCCHQDHAGVGSALPDRLQYFRIERLKAMGCNAYRTSHNPPTPELLDACDRLGMLVMDESRLFGSTPEATGQLERLILRDRNHPSVFIWSLGNEEWTVENSVIGAQIGESLKRLQRRLDPSRLCTFAADNGDRWTGVNSVVDVRGVNYIGRGAIDGYHREHPGQPVLGSEEASTFCTRGIYANDTISGYVSDYDVNAPGYGAVAERWWKFYADRPWLAGAFVWTGFDYRGEPSPYSWPCISSHFGIMDVCGFAKNNFYYYQSWWSDSTVLHLAPHWNWKGKEGSPIDVWCQSNCDSVELFLNGTSQGRKSMQPNSHLEWKVPYTPGTLEARGWRKGRLFTSTVETTGRPVAVHVSPDRTSIDADGRDVSVMTVTVLDSAGREVSDAGNLIRFTVEGEGKVIGVGNGDPSSHEPDKCPPGSWQRKLFNGLCQVIVQSTRHTGAIRITASSDGMADAHAEIVTSKPPTGVVVAE